MMTHNRYMATSRKALFIILLGGVFQGAVAAGPFGLTMGVPKEELALKPNEDMSISYIFDSVPVPSPYFETYAGSVGEQAGLCNIRAITGVIDTNRFGHSLRSQFDKIKEALRKRYGEPKLYDFIIPGSLWDEPQDFMMGMLRDDRKLAAFWSHDNTPLGSDLQEIMLEGRALSTTSGALILQYDFLNIDECRIERERLENRGLY